jgi:hypothetical protein
MSINIIPHVTKASPDELARFENLIGASLPDDYRAFMLDKNGGRPDFSNDRDIWFPVQWNGQKFAAQYQGSLLESLGSLDAEDRSSLFRKYLHTHVNMKLIPADTISIGAAADGAVLLGIGDENRGKIFFWAQAYMSPDDDAVPNYDNVGLVAPDFTTFLKSLRPLKDVEAEQAANPE